MDRWAHQVRGCRDVLEAFDAGHRRVCLASPTGGGKTLMVADLIAEFMAANKRVVMFSNRRMMIDQLCKVFDGLGVRYGVRAAGHDDERHLPLQISSLPTEIKRFGAPGWALHDAHLVVCDEAHLNCGPESRKVLDAHVEAGAFLLGVTATPMDLEGVYTKLIVAGTASELRACGALVLATHFGCDEPDWKEINKLRRAAKKPAIADDGNVSETEANKAIMRPGVFGRVLKWFDILNTKRRPTILFAPDVAGSIFFAEEFHKAGISAAHIDGEHVWRNGQLFETSQKLREEILEDSKTGRCVVLCNRFVLREGVDCPWLGHGIFATVFGGLSTYIQAGGRLLRNHPSLAGVTIQDHGGNWWRWGSLNADRQWFLGATSDNVNGLRVDQQREKKISQPSPCPKCQAIQVWKSRTCRMCGHECKPGTKVSRSVVQSNGELREMVGDIFRPHRVSKQPDGPRKWRDIYFASLQPRAKGRTFRAAMAFYALKNFFQWPDRSWPFMPIDDLDFFRRVVDVPMDTLVTEEMWDQHLAARP